MFSLSGSRSGRPQPFERDQTDVVEFAESDNKRAKGRFIVDDLDDHRHVVVEPKRPMRVQSRGMAIAQAAAQHRGSGQLRFPSPLDDDRRERLGAIERVLVGIDPQQDR